MHRVQALMLAAALAASAQSLDFSGQSALEITRKVVAFGARPPASAALKRLEGFIREQLKGSRATVSDDAFTANTPQGPMAMKNLMARFAGTSGRAIVVTGHYDTKLMPGINFVGANDGGSSAGFLLELARVLHHRRTTDDIYLVWFDGEEAIGEWSDTDGIHGSRHLAARWAAEGFLSRVKALINVDMIGDRDLLFAEESQSSPALRRLVRQVAGDLGYAAHFETYASSVTDDHVPFVRRGVNAIDLIDFTYGPQNSYWHSPADTMDKLSARSLEITGRIVLELIRRLDGK